ncbi:MAG: polysaccharide deacetylase family protein [Butyrivibrio sp.]|nr:polysaccharide deacetylase family protein [Acetatifactor muris]MCM1559076.1 polysaccharide deacetylase family protein [Butyrivibrio sp.]
MLYLSLKSENRMDDIMAEDNKRAAAARRQRIQMLKKCIILTAVMVILLPTVLCFILLERIQSMDKTLDSLIVQVETLTNIVTEQEKRLDELNREAMTTGEGSARSGGAEREQPEQEWIPAQNAAQGAEEEPGDADTVQGEEGLSASDAFRETEGSGEASDGVQPEGSAEAEDPGITAAHKVYLTFDDGPSKYTYDILDILDSYGVKATFFVVGKETDYAREAMQEIVNRGHTLGMHSYSHKYAEIYNSPEDFAGDYRKIHDYVYEVTGVESTVYRFPGGSSNSVSDIDMEVFADYLDTQGVRFFDWNIASGDGGKKLLSVEELVKNSTAGIERFGTSVILMHDAASKSTTVEALPTIIENILALEDTVILPITEDTELVQHIKRREETPGD